MFQRVLSVLLSASLLAGSVTSTAYAAPADIGYAAAIETEADENQNPEETSEADLQETPETSESTDESQITDAADEDSDVSDAIEETGNQDETPADSEDVSDETGGGVTNPEDTTESTDEEDTEESEDVDAKTAEKYVTAAPFAVAPMAEGDVSDAKELTLNNSESVTLNAADEEDTSTIWLKFTAGADGDYLFSAVSESEDASLNTHIAFYKGEENAQYEDSLPESMDLSGSKNYENGGNPCYEVLTLEAGDEIYLCAETSADSDQEFDVKVTKVVEPNDWTATGSGDSSYSASVGNRTVTITPVIGYTSLSFNINTGSSEYTHIEYTVKDGEGYSVSGASDGTDIVVITPDPDGIHAGTEYSLQLSIEIEKSERLVFSSESYEGKYDGNGFYFTTLSRLDEEIEELQLDELKEFHLDGYSSEDNSKWLQFTAEEEGDYQFWFRAIDNSDIWVYLYKDYNDESIANSNVYGSGDENPWSHTVSLSADEKIYIQTYPLDGEVENSESFQVQVTKKEAPVVSAQELELDRLLPVSLDENRYEESAKWLKFTAPEEGSYQFRFETTSGSDIWVYLYQDATDGEEIDSENVYSGTSPWSKTVELQANQQVYIKAWPWTEGTAGQSFNVTVSKYIRPEIVAEELTLGTLTNISLDANRTEDEAKWLKVTAPEAGEYLFWFNTKNSSDIYVYLYQDSADGSQIGYKNVYGSDGGNNNPWSKTVSLEANQQVYIKAYPYSNGASGQSFDVKVSKAVEVTERTQNEDGSYQAVVNGRTIKVTPDVSYRSFGATVSVSPQTSTTVNYVVKDEDGNYYYNEDYDDEVTASNGVATFKIPYLEMGKKYFLELSLLIDRNERVVFASSTNPIEFTTLSIEKDGDDREVKVSVTPRLNRADLNVTVAGKAAEYNDNTVKIFYRKASDQEWTADEVWLYGSDTETLSIYDLLKETEYTYVVGFTDGEVEATPDNLSKSVTGSFTTLTDDRTITRLDITPGLTYADMEITLGGKAAVNNDNLMLLYYREKGAEQWERQTLYVYGTKDDTRISRYNDASLKEDTAYEYVIGFAENTETTQENLTASKSGEFSTIKDDRELSVTVDTYLNRAELNFVVSGNAAKSRSNYIGFYYREQGSEAEWDSVFGSKYGVGTYTPSSISDFNGEDLKQGVTYEYEYGFGETYYTERENLTGGNKGTFTIPTDDRKVTVSASDITTKPTSASIRAAVTGKTADGMTNYVLLYYKDSDSEDGWTQRYTTVSGSGIASFSLYSLESGKTYDYVIGIGDYYSTGREELTGTAEGTFTTTTSTLELTDVKLSAGYERARVQASFVGNNTGYDKYIYFFYRPKNVEGENSWRYVDWWSSRNESYSSPNNTITGLEQGVAYECAVVVGDYGISSPDDVSDTKLKKISEFTTKKSAYTLDIKADESLTTYNSAVLKVTAAGGQDEKVNVNFDVYKVVDDGQEYVNTYDIDLKQGSNYQGTVKLSGLEPKTTYVLSSASISVSEEEYYLTEIDTVDLSSVTFTTTEAKVPDTITITPDKVTLNLTGDGDGISYKMLKADVSPADAAKDLYWEYEDYGVVYINSYGDYAYIYPQGVGTTKVYARSSHDPEKVYGVCEVTVKDYVIKTANGEPITDTNVLSKGKTLGSVEDKLGLYERKDDGTYTAVENFNVEVYRSNVASWNDGVLTANAVGTTNVVFTAADGGKAVIKLRVTVAAESKGFGITGLTSSNSNYPAKGENGNYKVAKGYRYTAVGEISPTEPFYASDFIWTTSDANIATVANGVITTVAKGDVTITVTPVIAGGEESPYKQDEVEIKLTVQDLPSVSSPTVYALTNLDGTKGKMSLKDVNIVETLGAGWSWVYPDTPLYSLPTNSQSYAFEAVYSGTEFYPCETKVNVYIGTVTGVSASEYPYDSDGWYDDEYTMHDQVIAVSGDDVADTLRLRASIGYNGRISSDVVVSIPSQDGLTVEEATWYNDDYGTNVPVFLIKATKAGTYDLKPQVVRVTKDASGETKREFITQASYKIQAVANPQVGSIEFTTTDKDITIDDDGNGIYLDYTASMKNKTFDLTAIVRDRQGNRVDTALQWKVTDGAVAGVKAGKDTHTATVTVKGDGHAILSVAAKDAAGYTEEFVLEFRDHKPRVSTNKASINLAYDYDDSYGRSLAQQKLGVVEVASVYNESIQSVMLYDKDGAAPVTNMSLYRMSGSDYGNSEYIVRPVNSDSISTGTYQYKLAVKTVASKTPYLYDLKVTVTDKAPKVTAKMQDTINLFYLNKTGSIKLSVSNDYPASDYGAASITWKQQSTGVGNGFSVSSSVGYSATSKGYFPTVSQQQIQMNGKNLADPDIAVGTLTVKLNGIRNPIVINNFKMKWNYKKPTLKTEKSTTNIVPETGNIRNSFVIRDSLTKLTILYGSGSTYRYYSKISSDKENVVLSPSSGTVTYTYNGNNSKENLTLTVESDNWRETLTAKHTIKTAKPKAYLTSTQLTYNLAYKSEAYTSIGLKDAYGGVTLRDVAIEGSNANAKKLVEEDIFEISSYNEDNARYLSVKLNKAALMMATVKKGTYAFKLTPYYTAQDGSKVAMNTLNLKLKVEDKAPTVSVSTKGKMDLAKSALTGDDAYKQNSILVKPTFKNLGSSYSVSAPELLGEYSEYFYPYYGDDGYYHLIYNGSYGKLKAGQAYKFNVRYTVRTNSDDEFTVTTTKPITIKPVQTAPKITVKNNGQTFYAGATSKSRTYNISVPENYRISSVSGSLDCNKDGIADIIVDYDDYGSSSISLTVEIIDEDAVTASSKGKTYNVPITVRVVGRDGVAKDATTTIKVVVKR